LFDYLVEPVRTLEMLCRSWPFPGEFLDALTTARDSLWLRLRVLVISAKYGPASALAFEEAELSGDDRKEAAAAAKGRKPDQTKGSGGSEKKKQHGSSSGAKKTCHNCGGSSHLAKDCPAPRKTGAGAPSK
jgi:hypothetical protein